MNNEQENIFFREPQNFLSDDEIKEIVADFNDDRLRSNEDIEHFTIHIGDKVRFIPKRKYIYTNNGQVAIEDFLQRALEEDIV